MMINIVNIPKGEVPIEHRESFCGIFVRASPAFSESPIADFLSNQDFQLTGSDFGPYNCFAVLVADGLMMLKRRHPEAARWLEEHLPPDVRYFIISDGDAQIIDWDGFIPKYSPTVVWPSTMVR